MRNQTRGWFKSIPLPSPLPFPLSHKSLRALFIAQGLLPLGRGLGYADALTNVRLYLLSPMSLSFYLGKHLSLESVLPPSVFCEARYSSVWHDRRRFPGAPWQWVPAACRAWDSVTRWKESAVPTSGWKGEGLADCTWGPPVRRYLKLRADTARSVFCCVL